MNEWNKGKIFLPFKSFIALWASWNFTKGEQSINILINKWNFKKFKKNKKSNKKHLQTCWLRKETKPKPLERPVFWSHITLASLHRHKLHLSRKVHQGLGYRVLGFRNWTYEQVEYTEKHANKVASVTSGLRSPTKMLKWSANQVRHSTHYQIQTHVSKVRGK